MTSQSKPFEEPEASEVLRWRPLWITMTTSSVASSSTMWGEPETSGGHVTTSSLGDDPVSFPAHALIPTNYRHFTNVQNKSALSAFPVACPGSAMHVSLPAEDFYSTGTKWCQDKVAGTKFIHEIPCPHFSFDVHAWMSHFLFMPEFFFRCSCQNVLCRQLSHIKTTSLVECLHFIVSTLTKCMNYVEHCWERRTCASLALCWTLGSYALLAQAGMVVLHVCNVRVSGDNNKKCPAASSRINDTDEAWYKQQQQQQQQLPWNVPVRTKQNHGQSCHYISRMCAAAAMKCAY